MDGTIFDSEPVYRHAWLTAATEFGYEIPTELYDTFVGIDTETCEAMLREHVGSDFPMVEFRRRWQALFHEQVAAGQLGIKPGLAELLQRLSNASLKLGIATGSARSELDLCFAQTDFLRHFQTTVTSDDVANCKPAPDLYLLACQRLDVTPADTLVFEDTNHGVESALAAGAQVVMVPDTQSPQPEIAGRCLAVLPSLREALDLPGVRQL